ncbi:putative solute:sodium symporter small subunit [Halogranum gelatinilyticum]|uniref:Putative solute:sodium symporter small subunit n=1 Tax=Halogranum gelatinilyticum TaxID=660521 RepID=A0A1G9QQZ6_9EURY|nr:DUF4212 domain-containing protein [Halogranum gelatinilyticum]SDM12695.1 putative solute:sodium symporter small subunit [Halogranum gelatinilyticum]
MADNDTHDSAAEKETAPDGGALTQAARDHRNTDYLDREVNLLRPSTPFMRDHLRVIWTGFALWAVIVFGPVTATALVPGVMTTQLPVIGFPLHYFLVAIGAPGGALVLSLWYARKRDQLDQKYGIDHTQTAAEASGAAAAADGGVEQ